MSETVQYEYASEFAKRISREVLLRRLGRPFVLTTVGLTYLIVTLEGNRGFLWGVAFTLFIMFVGGFIGNEKEARESVSSLSSPLITVTFDENGMSYENAISTSTIKWQGLHSVTKLKSAWLFSIYRENNYATIPLDVLSDPVKAFVEKKMAENHKLIK